MKATQEESWIPVPGYEGRYEVSDLGKVRGVDRYISAGRSPYFYKGRMLAIHYGDRYAKVRLKRGDGGKTHNVHTLVAAAFLGHCPEGMEACHNNGNAHDNRSDNLRYDTHAANIMDRREHGTAFRRRNQLECFHGHPYTDDSFYIGDGGKRVCRICDSERGWRERAAKRAAEGRVHRPDLTECKYGHPLDGRNDRQRFCTTCRRDYKSRKKAERAAANA